MTAPFVASTPVVSSVVRLAQSLAAQRERVRAAEAALRCPACRRGGCPGTRAACTEAAR